MADEPELADADVPRDPTTADDLDLAAMGLEDVELTEEQQVAVAAAKARPVRKTVAEAPAGKGRATPKQRRARATGEEHVRATPVEFVRESAAELRKVVWPTSSQLQQYFVVVLVFVLFMIAIVSVLDLGFGTLMLRLLG